jgi:hypothetical protein
MPCPSHPPWRDHSNCTWRRVQVRSFSYAIPSKLTSFHLSPVQIFSSAPCSQTPFNVSVSDQLSHPYRTTGKITIFCILIFTFLDCSQNLYSGLNGRKAHTAARVPVRSGMSGMWWTKRHWDRFFESTSVSPTNHHSTNFSIIIFPRGCHNTPTGGRSAKWTQLDSTLHYTN